MKKPKTSAPTQNASGDFPARGYALLSGIALAVYVAVIWATHRYVPFMMDDLWYSTRLFSEEPVRGLSDILESQIWHYYNWGGRSIAHGILQAILMTGETCADALNVLATLLLSLLIARTAGLRKRELLAGTAVAGGLILGLNANWKMSMFWEAGAANYLYMTIFPLGFLALYLGQIEGGAEEGGRRPSAALSILSAVWILPLGIAAGWSNENIGPSVWIVSLLVILLRVRERKAPSPWMITGNLACLAGSAAMLLSPGNSVRSAEIPENGYGLLWRMFLRGYYESRALLEYLFPALLVLACILLLIRLCPEIRIGRRCGLLLLTALCSWGAMAASPHFPDRASFGTLVFLSCAILSLAGRLFRQRAALRTPLTVFFLLIWLRGMYFCGEFLAICWGWIR